jgi:hypothetical protein
LQKNNCAPSAEIQYRLIINSLQNRLRYVNLFLGKSFKTELFQSCIYDSVSKSIFTWILRFISVFWENNLKLNCSNLVYTNLKQFLNVLFLIMILLRLFYADKMKVSCTWIQKCAKKIMHLHHIKPSQQKKVLRKIVVWCVWCMVLIVLWLPFTITLLIWEARVYCKWILIITRNMKFKQKISHPRNLLFNSTERQITTYFLKLQSTIVTNLSFLPTQILSIVDN